MHSTAVLVVALLLAVAALVTIARRLGIAYPIFLVIGGLVLGFVPGVPAVQIEPDLIFLIVLPPILYFAAIFTPLRSLRENFGVVASLAVGLVIATALAAAAVAHTLIVGLTWAVAVALGAIVAPPDAIAATAVASRLAVPRRIVTILEGESLLNDATALTIYSVVIAAAVRGFSPAGALLTFVIALLGGVAIGLAVGWVIAQIRSRIDDTPGGDDDLAPDAVCSLPARGAARRLRCDRHRRHRPVRRKSRLPHHGPRLRLTGRAVWETITFLLNGFVFIVTGLQVPLLLKTLAPSAAVRLVAIGIAVTLVLVVVRALWIFGLAYVPRVLAAAGSARRFSSPTRSFCPGPGCAASCRSPPRSRCPSRCPTAGRCPRARR